MTGSIAVLADPYKVRCLCRSNLQPSLHQMTQLWRDSSVSTTEARCTCLQHTSRNMAHIHAQPMLACRPGRLDKVLYVPLPGPAGRTSILHTLARKTPLGPDVDIAALGEHPRAQGLSGADLQQLLREAAVAALKVLMQPVRLAATLLLWADAAVLLPAARVCMAGL